MPRPGDENHVDITLPDNAIEMHVNEIQPRRGTPVPQQARLDVLYAQRLFQKRIIVKIDLTDG